MKWISTRTWKYKKKSKECWHYWFAWHPVVIKEYPDGAVEKLWLKKVKRKGTYVPHWDNFSFDYEYREI
jgi:hypothetical protein